MPFLLIGILKIKRQQTQRDYVMNKLFREDDNQFIYYLGFNDAVFPPILCAHVFCIQLKPRKEIYNCFMCMFVQSRLVNKPLP